MMAFVNSYIRWLLLFLIIGCSVATVYPEDVVAPKPELDSLLRQFVASAEKAGIEFSPKCKTLSVDERKPLTYLDEAVGTLSKTRGLHNDGSVYPSSSILYSVTPSSPDGETCSISLMWNSSYNGTTDLVQSDTTEAFYLASKLISIMTYSASENLVANGNTSIHFPPEEINMKRNGIFARGFTKPVCTHLDTSKNSFTQEGCQTDASEPRNGVSCICDTGTSFALLTDVTIMLTNQKALVIVLSVGIALSLFFLIFLIVGTCIFQRLKYLPERHTIRSLAMALIFANISLLCDTVVDWRFIINYPNLVTLAVHFSLLAVCMWLLILIFDFVIKMTIESCRSNSNTCLYQTFGWGIPILIAGLSAGLLWDYFADEIFWPWLDPDVVYVWTVVGPILVVILLSFGLLLTFIICRCLCDIFRVCERCCDSDQRGDTCRCCCRGPGKVTVYRTEHRERRHLILKAAVLCFLLIFITATLLMGVMATRSPALQYVFAISNGCIGFVLFICVYLLSKHVEREYVPSVVVDSSIHGQTLVDVQYDPEITVSGYRRDYVNEGFEMREPSTSQEPEQTQLSRKKYTKVFYTEGSSDQQQYYSDRRNEQVNIRYVDEQPEEVVRRRDADIIVERRPGEMRERVDIEQEVVTGKYYTDSGYQQTSVGRNVIITEDEQREPERIRGTRSRKEIDVDITVERRPRELRERVDIEQDVVTGKYYRDSDYRQKSVEEKVIITEDLQREPERIRETRPGEGMDAEIRVERRPREMRERVDIEQDVVTGKYYRDSDYQQRSIGRKVIITEDQQRVPERIRGTRSREEMDAEIRFERRPTELREKIDIQQDAVTGKYYRDGEYQQRSVEKRVLITEDQQREPEPIRGTRSREEVDAEIKVERRSRELRERFDIEQDVVAGKYYRDSDYQQRGVGKKVIITEDEQREPERIRGTRSREEMDAEIRVERRPTEYYRDGDYQQKSVEKRVIITEDEQREPERIRETRDRKEIDADIIIERRPRELRKNVDIEQDVVTGKYYRDSDYKQKSVERKVIITEDEPKRIRGTRSREEIDADIVIETRPRESRERVDIEQDVVTEKYYPRDSDYQQERVERKIIEDVQREPERVRGTRSREEINADIIIERSDVDIAPKQPKRYASTITLQGNDIFEKLRVEKLFELENYLESRVPSRFDDRKMKFVIQDFGGGLTQLAMYSEEPSLYENIPVDRPFEAYIVNGDGSPVVDRPFMFHYDRGTGTYSFVSTRRFSQPEKYYTSRERIEYTRPKETLEEFTDKTKMQKLPKFKRIEYDDLQNEYINGLDIIQLIIPYPDENRYDIRYMTRCKEGPWDTMSLPANETYIEAIIVERDGALEQLVILKYEDKNTYSIVQSNTDIGQLRRSVRTEEYTKTETSPIKRRKPVFKKFKGKCCGKDQKKEKYIVVKPEGSRQRPKQQEVVEMSTASITSDDRRQPVERRREFSERPRQQEFVETTTTTTIVPGEKTYEGEIRPLVREEREISPQRRRREDYVEEIPRTTITEEEIKSMKTSDGETRKTWGLQRRGESPRRQQEYIEETTTTTITDETRQPGERRREFRQRPTQQEFVETTTKTTIVPTEKTYEREIRPWVRDETRQPDERRREFPQRPTQQEFVETTTKTTIVPGEETYEGESRPWIREDREKFPQRRRREEYVEEIPSTTITEEEIKEPMKTSEGETRKTWLLQRRGESPRRQKEYIEETTTKTITDETRKPVERRRESPHRYRQQEQLERPTTTSRIDEKREPTTPSWVGQKRRESPRRYRQEEIETATTTFTVEERAREPTSKTWVGEKRWYGKPSDGEIRESGDERLLEFPRRRTQPEYAETTRLTTEERTSVPDVKTFGGEIQPLVEEQVGESPQHRQQEYEQRTTTIITDEGERAAKPWIGKRVSKYPSIPRKQEYIEVSTDKTTVDENIRQPAAIKSDGDNRKWVMVGDRRWESSHKPKRQEYTETTITETTTTKYDRKKEPVVEISDDNIRTSVGQKPWESPRRLRQQGYREKTTSEEEIQESEKTYDGEIRTSTTATTIEERPREPAARKPGVVWIGESRGYSPQSRRDLAYVEITTTTTETEEPAAETFEGEIRTRVGERQPEYLEKSSFTTTTTVKTPEEQPVKALVEEQVGEYPRQQRTQEYERFTTTTKPDYGEITLVFEIPKQEYVETTISTTKTEDTTEPDSKTTDDEVVALVEERVGELPQRPRQDFVETSITTTKTKEEIREPAAKPSGDDIPSWVLQRRGQSPQRPRQDYIERSVTTRKTKEEIKQPGAKPSDGEIPSWVLQRRGESPQRPRQEFVERSITTTKTKEERREPNAKPAADEIPSWVLQRRGESPQRRRQDFVETSITTTKTKEEIQEPGAKPSGDEIPSWVLQRRGESPQRPRQEFVETNITTTKTQEKIKEPGGKPSGDEIPSWVLQRRGESPQRPRQEFVETSITTTKTKEEIKEPGGKPSGDEIPSWVLQRRGESPQRPRQEFEERSITTTKTEEEIKQPGAKSSDGEIPSWVLQRRGESPQRPRQEYVERSITTTKTREESKQPGAKPSGDDIPSWVLQRRGESPQRPMQAFVETSITTTKTKEEINEPAAKPSGDEIPSWVLKRRGESPQRPRQEFVETSITTTKTKEEIKEPGVKPSGDEIPSWVLQRRGESPQRPRQEFVETSITTTKTETTKKPDAETTEGEIFAMVEEQLGESPQIPRQEYVKTTTTTTTETVDEGTEQPATKTTEGSQSMTYEEDGAQRFEGGSSTTVQQIRQGSSDFQSGEFISGGGDEYVSSSSSMAYGMTSESTGMVRSTISGAASEIVGDDSQVSGDMQERMTVTESRHTFRSHPSTESGQHRFRTEISGVVLRPRPPTSSFGSDVSSIVHDVADDIKKSYFSFTDSL